MVTGLHNVTTRDQNYINHVAFVIDASGSMSGLGDAVVKVMDAQIEELATLSQKMGQETRVTVYAFASAHQIWCIHFDMDVMRKPSLRGRYRTYDMTALIDATMLSIKDLQQTFTKYGDHSFLVFAITDGHENDSKLPPSALQKELASLDESWTVSCLVPNEQGERSAIKMGFKPGNILIWDATSREGLERASQVMSQATSTYMTNRTKGIRGTRNLFQVDEAKLKAEVVKAANLKPLDPSQYLLVPVPYDIAIKDFVEQCTTNYQVGTAYFQLNSGRKPTGRAGVIVQGTKQILVREKATNKVFGGQEARQLVGLPDHNVTVDPTKTDGDFDIFVQSTSLNRKLFAGTQLLLLTGK